MIIKRKRFKRKNGKRTSYIDDSIEFYSFQEIRELCYKEFKESVMRLDVTVYKFVIIDINEEVNVACQWVHDIDGFDYPSLEITIPY